MKDMYLISTQKRKRLTQDKLFEILENICDFQLPTEDAKYITDIWTGRAMYEIPKHKIVFTDKKDKNTISFTTHPVNQTTSYFMNKYGEDNGLVILSVFMAITRVGKNKKRIKNDLIKDAKYYSKTNYPPFKKQGKVISELVKRI